MEYDDVYFGGCQPTLENIAYIFSVEGYEFLIGAEG
jgi:hypothetical protein